MSRSICRYVQQTNKTSSRLFGADYKNVTGKNISFSDFVDWTIHEFLLNDGKIRDDKKRVSNGIQYLCKTMKHCNLDISDLLNVQLNIVL